MMDDDRNNVVCALHQGTWVTAGTCIGVGSMPANDRLHAAALYRQRRRRPVPALPQLPHAVQRPARARHPGDPLSGSQEHVAQSDPSEALGRPAVRLHRFPGSRPPKRTASSPAVSGIRRSIPAPTAARISTGPTARSTSARLRARIRATSIGSMPTGSPPIRAPSITTSPTPRRRRTRRRSPTPAPAATPPAGRRTPTLQDQQGAAQVVRRPGAGRLEPGSRRQRHRQHRLGRRQRRPRRSGQPRPRRALQHQDGLLGRLGHLLHALPQLGGRRLTGGAAARVRRRSGLSSHHSDTRPARVRRYRRTLRNSHLRRSPMATPPATSALGSPARGLALCTRPASIANVLLARPPQYGLRRTPTRRDRVATLDLHVAARRRLLPRRSSRDAGAARGCSRLMPSSVTQATCEGAGKVWYGTRCSVGTIRRRRPARRPAPSGRTTSARIGGVCNNPLYSDAVSCRSNGAQWAAATDIIRCEDAGGHWTGTNDATAVR